MYAINSFIVCENKSGLRNNNNDDIELECILRRMESFETKNGRRLEGTDEKNTLNHSLFVNNDAVSESSS